MKLISLVGGSASPFIDEEDGFTGERERVWIFLSLAAYGDENWIMVDAPNSVDATVGCQMCMGVELSSSGRMTPVPAKYFLMPSGM